MCTINYSFKWWKQIRSAYHFVHYSLLLNFGDFVCKPNLNKLKPLLLFRYPGDSICLCHHSSRCDPRSDPGLQYGGPTAVWLWGNQEQSTSKAIIILLLLGGRGQVGVGGLWRRCGVWLWKVEAVYGCQEEKGQERHQDTHWPAQQWSWAAGKKWRQN